MTYELIFTALADPTRRHVLHHLAAGPKSVGDIAALMPISRPAVSQHLAHLKRARLVSEQRAGTRRIYRIDQAGLNTLRSWLDALWDDALHTLKTASETEHVKSSKPKSAT
jgi:DNA-binding transcriptional ArsR family regulator